MKRLAPQPEGYNCADPDYSKPLPGEVVQWDGPIVRSLQPQPPGLDPWDKAALKAACPKKTVLKVVADNQQPSPF